MRVLNPERARPLTPGGALHILMTGCGSRRHAEIVRDCVYLALELRRHMEHDATVDAVIADGCAAVRRVFERGQSSGQWLTLSSSFYYKLAEGEPWRRDVTDEAQALADAITASEAIQKLCTPAEVDQARAIVAKGLGK